MTLIADFVAVRKNLDFEFERGFRACFARLLANPVGLHHPRSALAAGLDQPAAPHAGGEQTWSNSQSSSGQRKLGVNVTGQENGVRIDQIVEGTVASNSDLQEGDIIRQIDGQPVRSVSDVINAINKPSAENDVQLTVMRDGEQQTLTASFDQQSRYQAARPAMSGQNQGSLQQQIAQLRQEVKQLRQQVKSMQSNGEMSSDEKGGDSQQSEEGFSSLLESAVDIVTDDEGTAEKETSAGSNPAKSGNAGSGSPTGQSDEDSQR